MEEVLDIVGVNLRSRRDRRVNVLLGYLQNILLEIFNFFNFLLEVSVAECESDSSFHNIEVDDFMYFVFETSEFLLFLESEECLDFGLGESVDVELREMLDSGCEIIRTIEEETHPVIMTQFLHIYFLQQSHHQQVRFFHFHLTLVQVVSSVVTSLFLQNLNNVFLFPKHLLHFFS